MKNKITLLLTVMMFTLTAVPCEAQTMESLKSTAVLAASDTSEPTDTPAASVTPRLTKTKKKQVKKGLLKEGKFYRYYVKGKRLKNKWKKIDGRKYYFMSNGNAATYSRKINNISYIFNKKGQLLTPSKNKIMSVGKYKYYVTPKGRALTGWKMYGNKLYYMYRSGRCAANTTVDGVTLTKACWAKENTACKAKRKAMEIVSQITNSGMTKEQKLRACFNYTMTCRFVGAKYPANYKNLKKGWYYTTGLDIMTTRSGNCYGYASMFAILAKEVGYTPYIIEAYISDGGEHCFVKIDGRYYDNMGNRFGTGPQSHRVKNQWKL